MKKNAVFISFTLFVFAIICFAFGVFLIATPKASAMNIEYTENALDDYYALGSTLVCPQAKIKVDGNLLETKKSVLYYPDGKAIASTEFVLSNPGEYLLRYFDDYNGKTVYAEDGFIVKGKAYNVSGTMSTAFYGNTGVNKGNLDGLIVSLSSGDKFVYNKPLNLNGKKKTDSIVSFYVLPERQGTADVQNVKVRLTDAVDETNYIEAVMFANSGDENEFVGDALYGARSSLNPKYVGMHPKWYSDDKTELTFYEGNYYSIYRDVSYTSRTGYPSFAASLAACVGYGSDVDYSHAQKNQIENFNKPFSFALDYAERKLYGYSHGAGTWYSNNLIADFDDSLFFDVPWEGFTTGEAYLSIYSDMYSNSSFNFVILDIFDEDLTETEFAPESEPLIFVELPEGEIPYAIKGQPYRVFDAKAYSGCNGEIPCRSLVYRDYDTNSPKLCSVTDETFIPTDENTFYTIVYSAEDSFGNRVEKILDIPVRASREARISLTGSVDGAYTGEEIVIKQPVFEKANGNYTVSVVAALGT